uniref:WGS project CAEQ00000000 data, annotated contig 31 n=1 Tax=Trypanosoma congolense (strain IL3000) TaxID=1068625 RepID=F9WEU1_TRYCI|nr:unnamed protein product [Trypanosoma congolense IL3000]
MQSLSRGCQGGAALLDVSDSKQHCEMREEWDNERRGAEGGVKVFDVTTRVPWLQAGKVAVSQAYFFSLFTMCACSRQCLAWAGHPTMGCLFDIRKGDDRLLGGTCWAFGEAESDGGYFVTRSLEDKSCFSRWYVPAQRVVRSVEPLCFFGGRHESA